MYFFCIAAPVADIAALNSKGANMFFPTEIAGLINLGKNLPDDLPKKPPYCTIFIICALLNFISADMVFSILFLNLVICCCVKNKS